MQADNSDAALAVITELEVQLKKMKRMFKTTLKINNPKTRRERLDSLWTLSMRLQKLNADFTKEIVKSFRLLTDPVK